MITSPTITPTTMPMVAEDAPGESEDFGVVLGGRVGVGAGVVVAG